MIHIPRANLARFCFNIINICTNYKCIPVFRTDARLGCPQLWPWHLTPAFVRRSKGSEDPQNPHLSSPLFLLVHSLPLHTETLSYSEVEKIYKQVAAIEKRDDWGSRGSWQGRGWHGEELETASQRCFYSVRAGFPGLRGMNSFHTSLLISSQLQSLHSY